MRNSRNKSKIVLKLSISNPTASPLTANKLARGRSNSPQPMALAVLLLGPVAFTQHDVNSTSAAMMLLGTMKRQHLGKLWQPGSHITFEQGLLVGISIPFTMQDNHRAKLNLAAGPDKLKHFLAGFFSRFTVKIEPSFNVILAPPQFTKHAILDTRTLETQHIVAFKDLHRLSGEIILILEKLPHGGAAALQMPWRQLLWRCDRHRIGRLELRYPLHFLQKQILLFI